MCVDPLRAAERASGAQVHELQEQLDAANLAKGQLAREVRLHVCILLSFRALQMLVAAHLPSADLCIAHDLLWLFMHTPSIIPLFSVAGHQRRR